MADIGLPAFKWRRKLDEGGETLAITGEYGLALGIPAIEIGELLSKDRRLQRVQPAVAPASLDHVIFVTPTILAQAPHPSKERRIRSDDRAAVTNRAQILRRIEAVASEAPERAGPISVQLRAMGLSAVLDDWDIGFVGERQDRRHIGHAAVTMIAFGRLSSFDKASDKDAGESVRFRGSIST